jgi:signal peptidase I
VIGCVRRLRPGRPTVRAVRHAAVVVLIIAVVRTFLIQVYGITTPSMDDTLRPGDHVITSSIVYGAGVPFTPWRAPPLSEPRLGDVVVYRERGAPERLIKRVIGVPGDTVQMAGRRVLRNGRPLPEAYIAPRSRPDEPLRFDGPYNAGWHLNALPTTVSRATYRPTRDTWGPLMVPAGHFLLLGDNRDWSIDSRVTGFVAREQIQGKVLGIYASVVPDPSRPFPRRLTAARWRRIGLVR